MDGPGPFFSPDTLRPMARAMARSWKAPAVTSSRRRVWVFSCLVKPRSTARRGLDTAAALVIGEPNGIVAGHSCPPSLMLGKLTWKVDGLEGWQREKGQGKKKDRRRKPAVESIPDYTAPRRWQAPGTRLQPAYQPARARARARAQSQRWRRRRGAGFHEGMPEYSLFSTTYG